MTQPGKLRGCLKRPRGVGKKTQSLNGSMDEEYKDLNPDAINRQISIMLVQLHEAKSETVRHERVRNIFILRAVVPRHSQEFRIATIVSTLLFSVESMMKVQDLEQLNKHGRQQPTRARLAYFPTKIFPNRNIIIRRSYFQLTGY